MTPPPAITGEFTCEFAFESGDAHPITLRYEVTGEPHLPAIVVLGGISAHRHVRSHASDPRKGWWEALAGPGQALSAEEFRIVGYDWIGSDGTIEHDVTTLDQARGVALILQHLGIDHLHLVLGASYGAMVGQHLAAEYPQLSAALINISAAHRAHPFAIAWRTLQRDVITACADHGEVERGMALARQFALLSYRTPADLDRREARGFLPGTSAQYPEFQDEPCQTSPTLAWMRDRGADFAARFTPTVYRLLSRSIDTHRCDAARITVPLTCVAVVEDLLVPPSDIEEMVDGASSESTCLIQVHSAYGHDAFLKEPEIMHALISDVLRDPDYSTHGVNDDPDAESDEGQP